MSITGIIGLVIATASPATNPLTNPIEPNDAFVELIRAVRAKDSSALQMLVGKEIQFTPRSEHLIASPGEVPNKIQRGSNKVEDFMSIVSNCDIANTTRLNESSSFEITYFCSYPSPDSASGGSIVLHVENGIAKLEDFLLCEFYTGPVNMEITLPFKKELLGTRETASETQASNDRADEPYVDYAPHAKAFQSLIDQGALRRATQRDVDLWNRAASKLRSPDGLAPFVSEYLVPNEALVIEKPFKLPADGDGDSRRMFIILGSPKLKPYDSGSGNSYFYVTTGRCEGAAPYCDTELEKVPRVLQMQSAPSPSARE